MAQMYPSLSISPENPVASFPARTGPTVVVVSGYPVIMCYGDAPKADGVPMNNDDVWAIPTGTAVTIHMLEGEATIKQVDI